jgi:hypothetical protein
MHAARLEGLNKIGGMTTAENEAGGMNMSLHGSAESLLGDHGERIGIVDNDEPVDSFTRGRMADKLCNGLADTMNPAILLG